LWRKIVLTLFQNKGDVLLKGKSPNEELKKRNLIFSHLEEKAVPRLLADTPPKKSATQCLSEIKREFESSTLILTPKCGTPPNINPLYEPTLYEKKIYFHFHKILKNTTNTKSVPFYLAVHEI